MYCSHHSSRTKRRWRCVDYRRGACRALVDTDNGAIIASNNVHHTDIIDPEPLHVLLAQLVAHEAQVALRRLPAGRLPRARRHRQRSYYSKKGLIYHTIEQAVASRDSKQKEGLRMVLDEESP
ncbi:putative zinc finger protein and BTB domain-containing protein [Operophtera brumata]|uniref:Putative zinc finger protein and BTB domain-containing protein n=1 Tax=Operophtera brumata TaxID=104452 RepID=A0A0L7L031_OPEBR|nr:putative zinc finger protein and BTB domain-containing protein [Operophtera brumata]